jgi:hypothetical protein
MAASIWKAVGICKQALAGGGVELPYLIPSVARDLLNRDPMAAE